MGLWRTALYHIAVIFSKGKKLKSKSQTISVHALLKLINPIQQYIWPSYNFSYANFVKFEREKIKSIDNATQSKETKLHIYYKMVNKSYILLLT